MADLVRMRLEAKAVLEYEVDPDDYVAEGVTITPEEIAADDLIVANDDLYFYLDNSQTKWEVTVVPALGQEGAPDAV